MKDISDTDSQTEEAKMALYCGIDLHSNISYMAVLDDDDRVVGRGRVPNDLEAVLQALEP